MRLSVSNIAWDIAEDEAMVKIFQRHGIDAIDVAPAKYFPDVAAISNGDISRVKHWWSTRGMEIVGMQALLFGTSGLNVFGTADVQDAMLKHLGKVCRIAAGLGARHLVFGAPRNRDRSGLSDGEAQEQAVLFFRRLGDIARTFDVTICLEPNPTRYGANFMTTSEETANVVASVAHNSIKMQFDTGALAINEEDPLLVLRRAAELVGHVHLSEPDLLPLGQGGTDHKRMAAALQHFLPGHVATIEVLATSSEPHTISVERSLAVAVHNYRDRGESA